MDKQNGAAKRLGVPAFLTLCLLGTVLLPITAVCALILATRGDKTLLKALRGGRDYSGGEKGGAK